MLVKGKTMEEHLANLQVIFSRLEETSVKLKRSICSFSVLSVVPRTQDLCCRSTYSWVSDKIKAIQKAPELRDMLKLKSLLGLGKV